MKQETAAQCWAHLDPISSDRAAAEKVSYRRQVVDALMTVAARHGAKIDWANSNIEDQVISFLVDPDDVDAFSHDLAALLGGVIG